MTKISLNLIFGLVLPAMALAQNPEQNVSSKKQGLGVEVKLIGINFGPKTTARVGNFSELFRSVRSGNELALTVPDSVIEITRERVEPISSVAPQWYFGKVGVRAGAIVSDHPQSGGRQDLNTPGNTSGRFYSRVYYSVDATSFARGLSFAPFYEVELDLSSPKREGITVAFVGGYTGFRDTIVIRNGYDDYDTGKVVRETFDLANTKTRFPYAGLKLGMHDGKLEDGVYITAGPELQSVKMNPNIPPLDAHFNKVSLRIGVAWYIGLSKRK